MYFFCCSLRIALLCVFIIILKSGGGERQPQSNTKLFLDLPSPDIASGVATIVDLQDKDDVFDS